MQEASELYRQKGFLSFIWGRTHHTRTADWTLAVFPRLGFLMRGFFMLSGSFDKLPDFLFRLDSAKILKGPEQTGLISENRTVHASSINGDSMEIRPSMESGLLQGGDLVVSSVDCIGGQGTGWYNGIVFRPCLLPAPAQEVPYGQLPARPV